MNALKFILTVDEDVELYLPSPRRPQQAIISWSHPAKAGETISKL